MSQEKILSSQLPPSTQIFNAESRRLIITKLVLENFKSYAGVREIGPFHKRFSAVVGPNGSGKSNIIDALLFVFGKRAKQLRQNKVSELIHKSDQFQNLTQATVYVHFQTIIDKEGDDYEIEEGSELVISRTALKNNTSKYSINGKTATWTEIGTLLKARGIDIDNNRFLILQGEVEQIALMKPKGNGNDIGLLEYLEDIIGTHIYESQIEEANKTLEEMTESRTEKLNRVRVVEKEKESLSGAKEEAEDYIKNEEELLLKKSAHYQKLRYDAEKKSRSKLLKQTEIEEKLKTEQEKNRERNDHLQKMEQQYKKETREYETLVEAMEKAKSDFSVYERKDVKLREDKKHLSKKRSTLEQQIVQEEQKKHSDAQKQIETIDDEKPKKLKLQQQLQKKFNKRRRRIGNYI